MLVLSREENEWIMIGSHDRDVIIPKGKPVRIQVLDIRGHKVRLGIEAPKEIEVHREEVWNDPNVLK